jgi:hypothetical protein
MAVTVPGAAGAVNRSGVMAGLQNSESASSLRTQATATIHAPSATTM